MWLLSCAGLVLTIVTFLFSCETEYIGKILSELKARPVYFVAEHTLKMAETAGASGEAPARSAAE